MESIPDMPYCEKKVSECLREAIGTTPVSCERSPGICPRRSKPFGEHI